MSSRNVTAQQKYCKVCHDAGKTEAEYRSHFTRESPDPKAKVVCPLLLSLECRYCLKNGHTVKYCPVIKSNEKKKKYSEAASRSVSKPANPVVSKPVVTKKSVFACLDCDSDEEEQQQEQQQEKEQVDEFPVLSTVITNKPVIASNYAAALLAKPKPVEKPLIKLVVNEKPSVKPVGKPLVNEKPAPWTTNTVTKSKFDWAAFDSDDEDDAFEEDEEQEEYDGFGQTDEDYDNTWYK